MDRENWNNRDLKFSPLDFVSGNFPLRQLLLSLARINRSPEIDPSYESSLTEVCVTHRILTDFSFSVSEAWLLFAAAAFWMLASERGEELYHLNLRGQHWLFELKIHPGKYAVTIDLFSFFILFVRILDLVCFVGFTFGF